MIVGTHTDPSRCHQEIAETAETLHFCVGRRRIVSHVRHRHHLCAFAQHKRREGRTVAVPHGRRSRRAREFVATDQHRNARSWRKVNLRCPAGEDHREEGRVDHRTSLRELVGHLHVFSTSSNM